ncbi:MFS transporter [Streptomyces sp. NPDC003077]|uniref:MFS transporter n=1 Tax=Streptomyces sp. NPDC003077 TaxID=3154443 RepID=UPI0033B20D79
MIIAIYYNIVFVFLPEIGADLGFTAQNLQWVVSAYAVAFGGFLLLGGRATDLFGRKNMFVLGMFLYAASSLVGALAGDPVSLIAARAAQGLGGAGAGRRRGWAARSWLPPRSRSSPPCSRRAPSVTGRCRSGVAPAGPAWFSARSSAGC